MNQANSSQIFSKTINYYDKSRPSYPDELFNFLENKFKLNQTQIIADIGSGTGIFTRLLLNSGYQVVAVEPNHDMRKIAEENLANYPLFRSIASPAEATLLDNQSIDIITVATAFHWFNPKLAKIEFTRILKPGGLCILIWNVRDNLFPIMKDYELLMENYVNNYKVAIGHHYSSDEVIMDFFSPNKVEVNKFPNMQILDLDGFKNRALSTSYSPTPNDSNYTEFLISLEKLFNKHQLSNVITLNYKCICYIGKLNV